jgi:hypothetical protein
MRLFRVGRCGMIPHRGTQTNPDHSRSTTLTVWPLMLTPCRRDGAEAFGEGRMETLAKTIIY